MIMNGINKLEMCRIWKKRLAWWAIITLPIVLVAIKWHGNGLMLLGLIWVFNLNYLEDRLNEKRDNSGKY